jgi:glycosyltransferase involved in cell wall biosynthesis
MKRFRILWINPTNMDTLLHNTALTNILTQLACLGHRITLVSYQSRNTPHPEVKNLNRFFLPIRYFPLLSSLIFSLILFLTLPFLILKTKPDFVVFNPDISVVSSIPSLIFKKKVKFLMDIRTTPVETSGIRGHMIKSWFSLSIITAKNWFHGFTTLTNLMKLEICEEFSLSANKVGVWTSGVSITAFDPGKINISIPTLKTKLDLNKKFIVFYHGIFTPSRGLIETVEAIQALVSIYPDIVLFLLGTGPLNGNLKTLIRDGSLEKSVIIHNPVDQAQVPMFIAMSDVCIVPLPDQPYWRCQSPLKLLEYLAMEKPVILTDIPAHRNVVGGKHCAIFISSINPYEISKAIEHAYHNKQNLYEWGKVGRQIVENEYTWRKIAGDLEEYLLSLS